MPLIIRNKNNIPHKLNVKNAEIQVSVIIVSFILKSSVMLFIFRKKLFNLYNQEQEVKLPVPDCYTPSIAYRNPQVRYEIRVAAALLYLSRQPFTIFTPLSE